LDAVRSPVTLQSLLTPREAGVSRHGDSIVWKQRTWCSGRSNPSKNSAGAGRSSISGKCDDRWSGKSQQLRWSPLRKPHSPAFSESTRASSRSNTWGKASSCADSDANFFLQRTSNSGESPGGLSKEELDVQFDRIFQSWDSKPGAQLFCKSRAVGSLVPLRSKLKSRHFFMESLEAEPNCAG